MALSDLGKINNISANISKSQGKILNEIANQNFLYTRTFYKVHGEMIILVQKNWEICAYKGTAKMLESIYNEKMIHGL